MRAASSAPSRQTLLHSGVLAGMAAAAGGAGLFAACYLYGLHVEYLSFMPVQSWTLCSLLITFSFIVSAETKAALVMRGWEDTKRFFVA